ncbi:hypothetical protein SAMN03159488_00645 [Pseudomonas sp. NFIX10]|uniref:hypothetical protein n=1 Tax=unclassified Pseudomonas TaxID=196821 RepID=UPI0008DF84BE|nr:MULTISPECIES: hypothetical protein [unclassified Pseudomonas]SFA82501.1 hypothetical protein SAMN03159488_00645 [Pseudomonas sp. NFIX10]SFE20179.1 hypothetical protein SAMN03159367_00645 [Pseudomonas sp. NFACC06-1]
MSLLSGLLDHIAPIIAGINAESSRRPAPRPSLALATQAERRPQFVTAPHASAATATPEWLLARDAYLNHIMACRSCYAPTARYCSVGAGLRASYDRTPMEIQP